MCIGVEAAEDARMFASIAVQRGFMSLSLLLDEHATRAAVRAKIDEMAAASEPGDLALLTFSGHGGHTKLPVRDRAPEAVGLWQLYDGSLNDEQLKADLGRFREGVRVLVVSDNCSGGIPSLRSSQLSEFAQRVGAGDGRVPARQVRRWHGSARPFRQRAESHLEQRRVRRRVLAVPRGAVRGTCRTTRSPTSIGLACRTLRSKRSVRSAI